MIRANSSAFLAYGNIAIYVWAGKPHPPQSEQVTCWELIPSDELLLLSPHEAKVIKVTNMKHNNFFMIEIVYGYKVYAKSQDTKNGVAILMH